MTRISAIVVLALAVDVATLCAQARHPVTGRVIASVMSVQGHQWLERPEREAEEEPAKAIAALSLQPGMSVADIGAGSGYYTVRLARSVGMTGRVFATDIQPGMVDLLNRRIKEEKLSNVTALLGGSEDPALPPHALDVALMVDVYHELQSPQTFMRRLRDSLKPLTGRLVLIEFRKEDPKVPIRLEHKMTVDEARQELAADGFQFVETIEVLPWQHILVFKTR